VENHYRPQARATEALRLFIVHILNARISTLTKVDFEVCYYQTTRVLVGIEATLQFDGIVFFLAIELLDFCRDRRPMKGLEFTVVLAEVAVDRALEVDL
jgi:hypothetical protein